MGPEDSAAATSRAVAPSRPLSSLSESEEAMERISTGSQPYAPFSIASVSQRITYHRVPSHGASRDGDEGEEPGPNVGGSEQETAAAAGGEGAATASPSARHTPATAAAALPQAGPELGGTGMTGRIREALGRAAARQPRAAGLPRGRRVVPGQAGFGLGSAPVPAPGLASDFGSGPASGPASGSGPEPDETQAVDIEADADDSCDDDAFKKKFDAPTYCWSRHDILQRRNGWLPLVLLGLAVYSTVLSGVWVGVALAQPRWGHRISSRGGLAPSTATLLTALVAKTIELSFVTVFIACSGQVLTRRALARRSAGVTLAEMTMRNWVLQPGCLVTHCETVAYAGATLLGALSLTATAAAMLYTTASEAMVAPKLKSGAWERVTLQGRVRSSYANAQYIKAACPALFDAAADGFAPESCLDVAFSGRSYRDLLAFMGEWTAIGQNGTGGGAVLAARPVGTSQLHDSMAMAGAWLAAGDASYSDVAAQHARHGRIVNNVTLAMPHPGVYYAARDPVNGILQPDELAGVGEYAIRAAVVSPAINVLCVNLAARELAPLVYVTWPYALKNRTYEGDRIVADRGWQRAVPTWNRPDGSPEFLNRTVVDDLFRWGPKYGRRPPVFPAYPASYNSLTNMTAAPGSTSWYFLSKNPLMANYTLCQMNSFLSPACSTHFNISGTAGAAMRAHCDDPLDLDAYHVALDHDPGFKGDYPPPSADWKWVAAQWGTSMVLNGGIANDNASIARILSQLSLTEPRLPEDLPSLAEALAVYASSTLVLSSIDAPFRHYWAYSKTTLGAPGVLDAFPSSIMTQEYTSGHINAWQNVFYPVLVLVFLINICCLIFMLARSEQVTDLTEPQNAFALAINSPPSMQLKGSCGAGPEKRDLVVPWRVDYAKESNHYFFQEASERPWRGRYAGQAVSPGTDYTEVRHSSYKRLSSSRGWM